MTSSSDVSNYFLNFQFSVAKDCQIVSKVYFCFIKAEYSIGFTNPRYAAEISGCINDIYDRY